MDIIDVEFSIKEVNGALFSMGNFKSLDPDGFHLIFFKLQWEHCGTSIYNFFFAKLASSLKPAS